MSEIKPLFRDYKDSDYESCEALVSDAWKFDKIFKPQKFSNVAKYMYTKGALIGSNFKRVVEVNGKVVGFIFGLNECSAKPKISVLFWLNIFRQILYIKGMKFSEKKKLLSAINIHEVNKSKIVERGKSEVTLFVIDPNHQGIGYGKTLLSDFITQCKKSGVKSIVVETNKLGASSFYEGIGFKHTADFDSPLHDYATKEGQACILEYKCE